MDLRNPVELIIENIHPKVIRKLSSVVGQNATFLTKLKGVYHEQIYDKY